MINVPLFQWHSIHILREYFLFRDPTAAYFDDDALPDLLISELVGFDYPSYFSRVSWSYISNMGWGWGTQRPAYNTVSCVVYINYVKIYIKICSKILSIRKLIFWDSLWKFSNLKRFSYCCYLLLFIEHTFLIFNTCCDFQKN